MCTAMALAAAGFALLRSATWLSTLAIAGEQAAIYFLIWRYAFVCRNHAIASAIVLVMAVASAAITLFFLTAAGRPQLAAKVGWFSFPLIFLQALIALWGCYIGYVLVEAERTRDSSPGSLRGKSAVILLLVPALVLGAWLVITLYR